jgi:hypothetical protein
MPGGFLQIVQVSRPDHEDVDINRDRTDLAEIARGPGSVDKSTLDAWDRTKCVSEHGQGAVRGGEQVGQRTGQQCSGGCSKQAGVAHPSVSDKPSGYQAGSFRVHCPWGHPDMFGCVSQAVLAVGVEIQQGEQFALHLRAQQRQ